MFVVWWNTDHNHDGDRSFTREMVAREFFDQKCKENRVEIVEMYDYDSSEERPILEWRARTSKLRPLQWDT